MNHLSGWQDTIVALATPPGVGAIAVIRLSGNKSFDIVNAIFPSKDLKQQKSHTAHFGELASLPTSLLQRGEQQHFDIIDEVLVTIFKNPKSYTGEDVVEISCHGSQYIQQQIIHACIEQGARLAKPGEFTQRAFLNGKMDLAQAEAVADLIASENKASQQMALNQMRGGVSSELQTLRDKLIHFTAMIELELDFAEEDVEFADRKELLKLIQEIKKKTSILIETFEFGNAIKNGVPVAIIGKPNSGKSTLLNALLKEDRAIVSDIAGTTRDVIEETITVDGIQFRFIDTAGIRQTSDEIEAIGVARAKEKLRQAKVVFHLYEKDHNLLNELASDLKDKIIFNLLSKVDVNNWANDRYENYLLDTYPHYHHFGISVKTGFNMDLLLKKLVAPFKNVMNLNSIMITNSRHKDALIKARDALDQISLGLETNLPGDLLSFHLKDALFHLGTITGKIEVDRDILGTIFGKFCIGK